MYLDKDPVDGIKIGLTNAEVARLATQRYVLETGRNPVANEIMVKITRDATQTEHQAILVPARLVVYLTELALPAIVKPQNVHSYRRNVVPLITLQAAELGED